MGKILLKGFYGFGNFGDDILMLTTYNIVKEIFPQAEIFVGSESKNPAYIHKYLQGVKIINSAENLTVNWIVHGGGGVFFDFSKHATKYIFLNRFIRAIGYQAYRNLYELFRKLRGNGLIKQNARAGLGIGVGTYTPSSNRFFSDILALSTFDILLVRDDPSVQNAKLYCGSRNIYKSTDLAFLSSHWMPTNIRKSSPQEAIGFVLRDWLFDNNVSVMLEVAKELLSRGQEVKFFALDEDSDAQFITSASSLGPVYVWNPVENTMENYLSELATCKLMISSRAHGAIVSACLGIPVCCVCIEPKLEQVAMMLNNSARTIRKPFKKEEALKEIEQILQELPFLKLSTLQDVTRNNLEISEGINIFRNFISSHPVRL